jgi:hypothetical protein
MRRKRDSELVLGRCRRNPAPRTVFLADEVKDADRKALDGCRTKAFVGETRE